MWHHKPFSRTVFPETPQNIKFAEKQTVWSKKISPGKSKVSSQEKKIYWFKLGGKQWSINQSSLRFSWKPRSEERHIRVWFIFITSFYSVTSIIFSALVHFVRLQIFCSAFRRIVGRFGIFFFFWIITLLNILFLLV